MTHQKLLSICIPSYNRGHRALDLVNDILDMSCVRERDSIEIILSDNGSTLYSHEYEQIRDMEDSHVVYSRNEENIGFLRNFNRVVKLSSGRYCILISDEDRFDEIVLCDLIMMLEDLPGMGMIKTGTSGQYSGFKAGYAKAGFDAIKEFYLQGNYISGTLYNRDYVTNELLDGLYDLYRENEAYLHYPHLFVEGCVLNMSDFYFYDRVLIIEGEDEQDKPSAENAGVLIFSSWESRNTQLKGYLDQIRDLDLDDERTDLMFRIAVWKTIWMIGIVRDRYMGSGIPWNSVVDNAGKAILETVSECDIPLICGDKEGYLRLTADFIMKELL